MPWRACSAWLIVVWTPISPLHVQGGHRPKRRVPTFIVSVLPLNASLTQLRKRSHARS
jgi:hypothetical protein